MTVTTKQYYTFLSHWKNNIKGWRERLSLVHHSSADFNVFFASNLSLTHTHSFTCLVTTYFFKFIFRNICVCLWHIDTIFRSKIHVRAPKDSTKVQLVSQSSVIKCVLASKIFYQYIQQQTNKHNRHTQRATNKKDETSFALQISTTTTVVASGKRKF